MLVTWINPIWTDYHTPSDWSTGAVPGPTDDVLFNLQQGYTIRSNQNETVNSLITTGGVFLWLGFGGTYTVTHNLDNRAIIATFGGQLVVGGDVWNNSIITIGGGPSLTSSGPSIKFTAWTTTIQSHHDGGQASAGNGGFSMEGGTLVGQHIVNVDNTFGGYGTLKSLILDNMSSGKLLADNSTSTVINSSGILDVFGIVNNSGQLVAQNGGHLVLHNVVFGSGTALINSNTDFAGTSIEFSSMSTTNVYFNGTGGTLKIDYPAAFMGKINGFAATDSIDLANFKFDGHAVVSFRDQGGQGVLSISNAATHQSAQVQLVGVYTDPSHHFSAVSDTHGGTSIIWG